jgi:hypothetical protein
MMGIGIGVMIVMMAGMFAVGGHFIPNEEGKHQEQHHQVAPEKGVYDEPVKCLSKIYLVEEKGKNIGP